jgi:HTH-type transcriptional regulator / antitoxin MqsA
MKCAACWGNDLVHEERDVDYRYGHGGVGVASLEADFCNDCGGFFMDRNEAERYVAAIQEARIEVNMSVVDPNFLKSARSRLSIDQRKADEIFCQRDGAFAAFENGTGQVPPTLIQLLSLLRNHPELLVEIERPTAYPREDGRVVSFPPRA